MKRLVVVDVADPSVWPEIEAVVELGPLVEMSLSPTRRALRPGSERVVVPGLRGRGLPVLVRRPPEPEAPTEAPVDLGTLSERARTLLHTAQRAAINGVFLGARAWHPVTDAPHVDALRASGAIFPLDPDNASPLAAWALNPALPRPPEPAWDFDEALFDAPDDLETPDEDLPRLLDDAAVLAAALRHVTVRRTHQGHLDRAGCKRLGRRLSDTALAETGELGRADGRWRRALDLLLGLGAVGEDALERTLEVRDAVVVRALEGAPEVRLDRAVRRLAPPETHALLPSIREALRQAGDAAVDDVVLLELLSEQQDGTFAPDAASFVEQEEPLLDRALRFLHAMGLVRRAPGAFAASAAGRAWAGMDAAPPAPVWVASDLEVVVPPGGLGPLDRYRLERLSAPVARDVVDRLRLTRDGLADWLVDGDVDGALALLARISPAVPPTVGDTLRAWAGGLTRVVVTVDVPVAGPDEPG